MDINATIGSVENHGLIHGLAAVAGHLYAFGVEGSRRERAIADMQQEELRRRDERRETDDEQTEEEWITEESNDEGYCSEQYSDEDYSSNMDSDDMDSDDMDSDGDSDTTVQFGGQVNNHVGVAVAA